MKGFNISDYAKNPDGTYSKKNYTREIKTNKGIPALNDKLIESEALSDGSVKIIFHELFPGLNSENGLLRMHWSKRDKLKNRYVLLLLSVLPPRFEKKVLITYTRFTAWPMDEDNLTSSFKIIGDALKEMRIIVDDSPQYLKLIPRQEKVLKKECRSEILINEYLGC
jgi:hypothetical protein